MYIHTYIHTHIRIYTCTHKYINFCIGVRNASPRGGSDSQPCKDLQVLPSWDWHTALASPAGCGVLWSPMDTWNCLDAPPFRVPSCPDQQAADVTT